MWRYRLDRLGESEGGQWTQSQPVQDPLCTVHWEHVRCVTMRSVAGIRITHDLTQTPNKQFRWLRLRTPFDTDLDWFGRFRVCHFARVNGLCGVVRVCSLVWGGFVQWKWHMSREQGTDFCHPSSDPKPSHQVLTPPPASPSTEHFSCQKQRPDIVCH